MFASLSIYGLWEYDNTIFDNMVLPADLEEHRQDLISEILLDCSDFSLLYPNADFMKMLIGVWSRNERRIWEKMLESELIEYNPIENYDRYETLTRTTAAQRNEDSTGSSSRADRSSETGSGSTTEAGNTSRADRSSETGSAGRLETGNSQDTTTGSTGTSRSETSSTESSRTGESSSAAAANADNRTGQTAYDSDNIKDTARAISTSANSGHSSESGSDRSSGVNALHETGNTDSSTSSTEARITSDTAKRDTDSTGSETSARSTSDSSSRSTDSTGTQIDSASKTGSETGTETVVNHMHGNIGVTTAAEMLAGFREISNFCTVKFIVDSFKDRFCVQVY